MTHRDPALAMHMTNYFIRFKQLLFTYLFVWESEETAQQLFK